MLWENTLIPMNKYCRFPLRASKHIFSSPRPYRRLTSPYSSDRCCTQVGSPFKAASHISSIVNESADHTYRALRFVSSKSSSLKKLFFQSPNPLRFERLTQWSRKRLENFLFSSSTINFHLFVTHWISNVIVNVDRTTREKNVSLASRELWVWLRSKQSHQFNFDVKNSEF